MESKVVDANSEERNLNTEGCLGVLYEREICFLLYNKLEIEKEFGRVPCVKRVVLLRI